MGSTLYSSLIFTMWKVLASQSSGGTHRKYFLELSCARVQSGFVHFIFIKETCSIPLRNKVCLLWLCWMSCFLWTDAPAVHSSFLWDTVGQNFEEEIGFWLRVCVSDCLKFFFLLFFPVFLLPSFGHHALDILHSFILLCPSLIWFVHFKWCCLLFGSV